MPQATEELRQKWGGVRGVGEDKAIGHLLKRGYTLTSDYCWFKPIEIDITLDDTEAIDFLIQEWDYGGLITNDKKWQHLVKTS